MSFIRQFFGILHVNLSGITQRAGSVLTIIIGVTCTVGVLVSMLAMGTGARRQEVENVREDAVVLNSTGARPGGSTISKEEAAIVRNLPGIRKDSKGEPMIDLEALAMIEGRRRVTGVRIYFPVVGVPAYQAEHRPEMHFTSGRMFRPGLYELIASHPCVRQFTGFEIGDRRPIRGHDWVVVGHFEQGDTQQCVVLADVNTIMSAFARNTYSQITVRLQSPGDYAVLHDAVQANPALHLEVLHERQAREDTFKELNALLDFVSYFVGAIMAIGATLGAVNAQYAMVDSRRRELATLRAIGFGPGALVASILVESVLLALPGALLGGFLAWAFFNGLSASPFGYSFRLAVTPALAVLGIAWALVMGLVGGLLPALRATRIPVTTALRAT
jgi:putative ABC transport system permease protein